MSTPATGAVSFANADGTAKKTLLTAGAAGTRIDAIAISTNDTASESVDFWLEDSASVNHYIGTVPVAAGSGYTTIARVDAMATLAPSGTRTLVLAAGWSLICAMHAAVTSPDATDVVVLAATAF